MLSVQNVSHELSALGLLKRLACFNLVTLVLYHSSRLSRAGQVGSFHPQQCCHIKEKS